MRVKGLKAMVIGWKVGGNGAGIESNCVLNLTQLSQTRVICLNSTGEHLRVKMTRALWACHETKCGQSYSHTRGQIICGQKQCAVV